MRSDSTTTVSGRAEAPVQPAAADQLRRAEDTRRRIQRIAVLPALPKTLALVPNAGAIKSGENLLSAVVSRDPAIAAGVLRLVNREGGDADRATGNLEHACDWIGTPGISRQVIDSISAASARNTDYNGEEIQRRSIVAGIAARCIAQFVGHRAGEELYCAALLHGLGRLALEAAYRDEYVIVTEGLTADARLAAEEEAFGLAEPEAGFVLAQAWNLPAMAADCIRRHRNVSSSDAAMPVLIVALAVELAEVFQSRDKEQCRRAAARSQQLCKPLIIPPSRLLELMNTIRVAVEADQKNLEQLRQEIAALPKEDAPPSPNRPAEIAAQATLESAPDPVASERSVAPERIYHRVLSTNRRVDGGEANTPDPVKSSNVIAQHSAHAAPNANASPEGLVGERRGVLPWLVAGAVGVVGMIFCLLAFRGQTAPSDVGPPENTLGSSVIVVPTAGGDEAMSLDGAIAFVGTNQIAPETAGYLSAIGDHLYNSEKDYARAAEYYKRLVDNYPAWGGTQSAYLRLADCYERLGHPDAAMDVYRKVVSLFPENSPEYGEAKVRLEATLAPH